MRRGLICLFTAAAWAAPSNVTGHHEVKLDATARVLRVESNAEQVLVEGG